MAEVRLLVCDQCPPDEMTAAVERVFMRPQRDARAKWFVDLCATHLAALPHPSSNGSRPLNAPARTRATTGIRAVGVAWRCDEHSRDLAYQQGADHSGKKHHVRWSDIRPAWRAAFLAAHPDAPPIPGEPGYESDEGGNGGPPPPVRPGTWPAGLAGGRAMAHTMRCDAHDWEGSPQGAYQHWRFHHTGEWNDRTKRRLVNAYNTAHHADHAS